MSTATASSAEVMTKAGVTKAGVTKAGVTKAGVTKAGVTKAGVPAPGPDGPGREYRPILDGRWRARRLRQASWHRHSRRLPELPEIMGHYPCLCEVVGTVRRRHSHLP